MAIRRRSRRYAIAFAFGQDIADVTEYQPGKHRPSLFNIEIGDGYAIALRENEKLPDGYNWAFKEDAYGYQIFYTAGEA